MREQAYIIAYDISSNTRRSRVAKHLEARAERVQKSVFVGRLTAAGARKLRRSLEKIMDLQSDRLMIEPVAGRTFRKAEALIF
jgi:CRISPR-associated endonuclease Cas2